jgi:hypothetical protein
MNAERFAKRYGCYVLHFSANAVFDAFSFVLDIAQIIGSGCGLDLL